MGKLPSDETCRGAAALRLYAPTLPSGRGMGKPGFPVSQPLLGAAGAPTGRGTVRQAHHRWGNPVSPYVHLSRPCGYAAHRQDEHEFFLGGLRPPKPSPPAGCFLGGLRPPKPSPPAGYVHLSSNWYNTPQRGWGSGVLHSRGPVRTLPQPERGDQSRAGAFRCRGRAAPGRRRRPDPAATAGHPGTGRCLQDVTSHSHTLSPRPSTGSVL